MKLVRWIPAGVLMGIIYTLSSIPSSEMVDFGFWDMLVKKGGHFIGYGMLALSFWYAMEWKKERIWLALLLVVLYALSDEFHQSFVPGRHPSWMDALVIDNGGAIFMLAIAHLFRNRNKQ